MVLIIQNKKAYTNNPEALRWRVRLKVLYRRHKSIVYEMMEWGYKHYTLLESSLATGKTFQDRFTNSYEEQVQILKAKCCDCRV
jgi:hypothetical protein